MLHECRVDLGHLPADGGIQLGHGLHGLDRAEDLALLQGAADFRELQVNNVAQRLLCLIGDPDSRDTAVGADPLVVLGVFQVGWIHAGSWRV